MQEEDKLSPDINNTDNNINSPISDSDELNSSNQPHMEENTSSFNENPHTLPTAPQESTTCKFDKVKDEKYKKIFSYASLPFFLGGAVLAMFKLGDKARNPYSFLIVVIALVLFTIPYIIRYFNLKKCSCSVCTDHLKVTKQFILMFSVAIIVFIAVFIYFLIA